MKNKTLIISLLVTVVLASCTPGATTIPSIIAPTLIPTAIPTATISVLPSESPHTQGGMLIEPYQDVRFQNISNLNRNLGESLIKTLWFDESTIWSRHD